PDLRALHSFPTRRSSDLASVTILDSTKAQDGLIGSVRRVKIQAAKLELKEGRLIEGPGQMLEITTYDLKGNRIENVSYPGPSSRSEEHTSELQSLAYLVC